MEDGGGVFAEGAAVGGFGEGARGGGAVGVDEGGGAVERRMVRRRRSAPRTTSMVSLDLALAGMGRGAEGRLLVIRYWRWGSLGRVFLAGFYGAEEGTEAKGRQQAATRQSGSRLPQSKAGRPRERADPCERAGPGLICWTVRSVGAATLEGVGDPGGAVRVAPNFRRIGQEFLVVVVHELVGRIEPHG